MHEHTASEYKVFAKWNEDFFHDLRNYLIYLIFYVVDEYDLN